MEELHSIRLQKDAKIVEDAIEDALIDRIFPGEHLTCVRTNNVIEGLIGKPAAPMW